LFTQISVSTVSNWPVPMSKIISTSGRQASTCYSDEKVDAYFDALQLNGQVILAPQKTFWSSRYAIVIDRFGVPWKLNRGT
jgi:uncharacterized glyoxalase superfamily protein PhnB